jgi:TRAP-type C4-dicarboxylate transport system permease small subunit
MNMWLGKCRYAARVIYAVSRFIGGFGAVVLVAMMLLTVADVFLRYTFNRPIQGTVEVTEFMMVTMVFPAVVWCTLRKEHVKVTLVVSRFSLVVQAFFDSISSLLCLGLFSLISWHNFLAARDKWLTGEVSVLLGFPVYPFYLVVAIGCGMVGLLLLTNLVEIVARMGKRCT